MLNKTPSPMLDKIFPLSPLHKKESKQNRLYKARKSTQNQSRHKLKELKKEG